MSHDTAKESNRPAKFELELCAECGRESAALIHDWQTINSHRFRRGQRFTVEITKHD